MQQLTQKIEGELNAAGLRFGLVVSRFNHFITDALRSGCLDVLQRHGADLAQVMEVPVPGSFEIPPVAKRLAESGKVDSVICLGAVIRGSTAHFDLIASEAIKGIAQVQMAARVPIIYGVITPDTIEQAIERAGSKAGNKGADAAVAAIEMVNLYRRLSDI